MCHGLDYQDYAPHVQLNLTYIQYDGSILAQNFKNIEMMHYCIVQLIVKPTVNFFVVDTAFGLVRAL